MTFFGWLVGIEDFKEVVVRKTKKIEDFQICFLMQACQKNREVYVTASVRNSSQWETSTGAGGERKRP